MIDASSCAKLLCDDAASCEVLAKDHQFFPKAPQKAICTPDQKMGDVEFAGAGYTIIRQPTPVVTKTNYVAKKKPVKKPVRKAVKKRRR